MTRKIELSLDDVADALDVLDFNDREVWVQMGMAIKSEFGETGFDQCGSGGILTPKMNMVVMIDGLRIGYVV